MRIAARSCHVLSRQPARDNRVVMMFHSSATTKITTMVKTLPVTCCDPYLLRSETFWPGRTRIRENLSGSGSEFFHVIICTVQFMVLCGWKSVVGLYFFRCDRFLDQILNDLEGAVRIRNHFWSTTLLIHVYTDNGVSVSSISKAWW